MSIMLDKVAPYLGQVIHDVYGRKFGTVVGVYSEVDGKVVAVEVMINDSNYETISSERLELKDDGIKIVPEWFVEAQKVEKKLDTLRKRVKALEELYKKGQIPQHAYKELKEKFDKESAKVKSDAKNVKEVMRRRIYDLENFVIHIEKAMTNLMVSYTSGELPENGFKVSADFMRYAKQTSLEEKKDLEKHVSLITKLEEELASVISSTSQQEQQETLPPVVAQGGPIAVKITN
ncbi:MAG: CdvA-like protein [Ignisphaera sp.]|uniref:CdvA-like coiled-coil domain-containing protein n=1 Tax=Ignisphaera aggregans TaxID=334771 RepID=A0A7C4JKZ2_9CREN